MVEDDPTRSYRQMADELKCSHTSVKDCICEDLHCRSYRRQTSQFLSDSMKALGFSTGFSSSPQIQGNTNLVEGELL